MIPYRFDRCHGLHVNRRYREVLERNNLADLDHLMHREGGELLKENRFRSVVSIILDDNGQGRVFYLKRHFWPWKERLKSLLPWARTEDARNEWKNMIRLPEFGFATMTPVAFGELKRFGLPSYSLTLTAAIADAEKLETYLPKYCSAPFDRARLQEKRRMIREIASFARSFHDRGFNHQDFYLGHLFYRPESRQIIVIDIQRVHQRPSVRDRDRIKDLAQLCFSAQGLGIFTATDYMRFCHCYFGQSRLSRLQKMLIRRVLNKAERIRRHTVKLLARRKKRL